MVGFSFLDKEDELKGKKIGGKKGKGKKHPRGRGMSTKIQRTVQSSTKFIRNNGCQPT